MQGMNLDPGMMDMMKDLDGAEVNKQAAGVARPVPCTGVQDCISA